MFMLAIMATCMSSSAMSMYCPAPVRARAQRGEDRDRRIHAGREIGDGDADFLRPAAGLVVALAGDAHQTAHGLDDEVVARDVRIGPVWPKPVIEQ